MQDTLKTIDFYRKGDFLNCYSSDALIVSRALGLTRLTVSPRHATPKHPQGISHTGFMVDRQSAYFDLLRADGWEPRVIE